MALNNNLFLISYFFVFQNCCKHPLSIDRLLPKSPKMPIANKLQYCVVSVY